MSNRLASLNLEIQLRLKAIGSRAGNFSVGYNIKDEYSNLTESTKGIFLIREACGKWDSSAPLSDPWSFGLAYVLHLKHPNALQISPMPGHSELQPF